MTRTYTTHIIIYYNSIKISHRLCLWATPTTSHPTPRDERSLVECTCHVITIMNRTFLSTLDRMHYDMLQADRWAYMQEISNTIHIIL